MVGAESDAEHGMIGDDPRRGFEHREPLLRGPFRVHFADRFYIRGLAQAPQALPQCGRRQE